MDQEDLVRKVVAMLDTQKEIFDKIREITTPEKLESTLDKIKMPTPRALNFLQRVKEEGIFKEHMHIKGMLDVWREWSRNQGIKEGHFLFEN